MNRYTYQRAMMELGRDDIVAAFTIVGPTQPETVGPISPDSVYYGTCFGYDDDRGQVYSQPFPMVTLAFNKYRSDLPPWENLIDVTLASYHDGEDVFWTLQNADHRATNVTGKLKTVDVIADDIAQGVDGMITEKEELF